MLLRPDVSCGPRSFGQTHREAETKEGAKRVKGRSIADGSEGWFTLSSKNFKPWSPQYKCAQGTVINDGLAIKEAKAVRKLEVGELVEASIDHVDQSVGL